MFERKNIIYYAFAAGLIIVANYVGQQFKQHFINEHNDDSELIQKYLLNESPFYGFNKPKIWIHTKYELNSRKWKDFMTRNTYNLNMPYVHYTIQSIVDNNQNDFHICLIDDDSFSKLIPGWDADVTNMPEPMKSYFREIGLLSLIHIYGGMIIPDSFLCMKPLINFYKEGISYKRPFVCERTNRTTNLAVQKHKMLFIPDPYFCGCLKADHTIGEFINYLKEKTKHFDFSDERTFLGDTSQWCIRAIDDSKMNLILGQRIGIKTYKRKTILLEELFEERILDLDTSCVGIYIPEEEILKRPKFTWFAYLSKEDILKVNTILIKYLRTAISKSNDFYTNTKESRNVITL